MAKREAPGRAHLPRQSADARGARAPQAPAQAGRSLGAAAQLAAVHRILKSGAAAQLKSAGAPSTRSGLAPAAAGGVVQLALEKGKLNVAGEHHDKSPARRVQEAGFAKHKLGADAKYWKENELTFTKTEWLFFSKIVPADPADLRFKHTVIYFKDAWETYVAAAGDAAKATAKERLSVLNKRLEEEISRADIEAPAHKDNVLSITHNLAIFIKMLDPPGMEGTALRLQYPAAQAPEINKRIARLEQHASIDPQGKTTAALGAETMMARSQAMYAAAKADAAQNGLWMVGEAHRAQIAAMPKAAFALTSKSDFNQQLGAWLEPQHKAADEGDRKDQLGMAARAYMAAAAAPLSASAAAHGAATTAAPPAATAAALPAAAAPTHAVVTATAHPLPIAGSASQLPQPPAPGEAAAVGDATRAYLAIVQSPGPSAASAGAKGPPPGQEMM